VNLVTSVCSRNESVDLGGRRNTGKKRRRNGRNFAMQRLRFLQVQVGLGTFCLSLVCGSFNDDVSKSYCMLSDDRTTDVKGNLRISI
jgi:hypothetical protein